MQFSHQLRIKLFRGIATIHGHEGLRGCGHAAVVQVKFTLAF